MGVRDARRLGAVEAAMRGEKSNREAAGEAKVSLSQFKRLRRRYGARGAAGLIHGNRGRPSPRRLASATRARVVELLQGSEPRFNDCHVRDLVREEGMTVSAETVRQIRRSLGLLPKRRRRPARHHRRRERAARAGAMVQIDGSPFHWFGPDRPPFCLVGTIDDATGVPLSGCFRPQEDLHGYTVALRDLIVAHGVPQVVYGDRTGIAVRNDRHWTLEEELAGRQDPTQWGRMLEELGIDYIGARSPEAKGRIERLWDTLQDRLPPELARHGITTPEAADAFLPGFFARCAAWFGVAPREPVGAWRPAPRHLERILACRYGRAVARDNTVTLHDRVIQVPAGPHHRSYARCRVEVRELLEGRVVVLREGRSIAEQAAPPGPFTLTPRKSARDRGHGDPPESPRNVDRHKARAAGHTASALGQLTNIRRPTKAHPWKRTFNPQPSPAGA